MKSLTIQLVCITIVLSSYYRLNNCRGLPYRFRHHHWKPCYGCKSPGQQLSTQKPYRPTEKQTTRPTLNRPDICNQPGSAERKQGIVICRNLTEKELEQKLKDAGGYIPRYMALKESEICSFKDLTADYLNEKIPKSEIPTAFPYPWYRHNTWRRKRFDEENDSVNKRSKRAITVGTRVRGCWGKGSKSDLNLHHLCSECPATTTLEVNRFPRYINEVICRENDRNAWRNIGRCIQRIIKLNFLQRTDRFEKDEVESARQNKEVYKRIWQEYTQEIRTCCECQLYPAVFNAGR